MDQLKGKLRSKPEIDSFLVEFSVEASLVQEYVDKVSAIRMRQRAATNRQKNLKNVHDYDWKDLVKSGGIQKLLVKELDKYLKYQHLSTSGKKSLKVSRIVAHVLKQDMVENERDNDSVESSDDESSENTDPDSDESSGDVVLASVIDYQEDTSDEESSSQESL